MDARDDIYNEAARVIAKLRKAIAGRLIGKTDVVDAMLTALVSGGHVLLEGVPGLAKTLAVKTFAEAAGLSYKRIQFTPDLLPGDVTGTLFYDTASGRFIPRQGPVFSNIVLADEINRAPAKVQSALLEAMEERQVSIGDATLALPSPFLVLATQNPIEHEGTFRLPEAQLDRFMLKVLVDYPSEEEERAISAQYALPRSDVPPAALSEEERSLLSRAADSVRIEDEAAQYAVRLVRTTRPSRDSDAPRDIRDTVRYIEYGASPRASIALYKASKAAALLAGRNYVLPDDIKNSAMAVLRHRVIPSYEAEADRVSSQVIIRELLSRVAVP